MNEAHSNEFDCVFVIGAGASYEFGLPTGGDLKDLIISTLDDLLNRQGLVDQLSDAIFSSLGRHTQADEKLAREQCRVIRDGLVFSPSIDNFLHLHRDNELLVNIGKLTIAFVILGSERSSTLYVQKDNWQKESVPQFSKKADGLHPASTYLGKIFEDLTVLRGFSEFCERLNRILFISFNYDRCILMFICFAAKLLYPDAQYKEDQLFDSIHVLHPYGHLGEISSLHDLKIKFGGGHQLNSNHLLAASKGIRTFTEGVSEDNVAQSIGEALSHANLLVFLGYGFLDLNNKILARADFSQSIKSVFSTCYMVRNPKQDEIVEFLGGNYRSGVGAGGKYRLSEAIVQNKTCSDFVEEWRSKFRQHY
ncbi:hypothetical protein [Pseudooceanicola spongiae]|uniref:SIR2-like domain-containing protein n=1 Tax=Pseudooceanicola spongiae TaxID=2613965 RepID=A0A7L9WSB5_9RHOB|nr:hypothetical protein [Pseudooceanicola spongiae]QOL82597.1 hypothetical protein F3W81_18285 [Pseudooceanicola spongiae]